MTSRWFLATANDGYILPLTVSLQSLARHLAPGGHSTVCVLTNAMSDRNRRVLEARVSSLDIRWIDVDLARFEKMAGLGNYTSIYFARLLADEVVPVDIDRVVYLDSDILVRSDVSSLFEIEFSEPLAACIDAGHPTIFHGQGIQERRGLADGRLPYFNSGLLVMNMSLWRRYKYADQALTLSDQLIRTFEFADQDVLNMLVRGDWKQLPTYWNAMASHLGPNSAYYGLQTLSDADRTNHDPAVVHFAGRKPWARHLEREPVPFAGEWWDEAHRTGLVKLRPKRKSFPTLVRQRLRRSAAVLVRGY